MGEGIDSTLPALAWRGTRSVRRTRVYAALAVTAAPWGCGGSGDGGESTKINGSIHVPAGKQAGPVATVNGSIYISAASPPD
jgi:hypothetical protein